MENNVCDKLLEAYERSYTQARRWQNAQLALGWATVIFIVLGIALVMTNLRAEGLIASALSLVSGGAATWFNMTVKFWHRQEEKRLRAYVKCDGRMQDLMAILDND